MIYCVYYSEPYEEDWGHKYFKHKHNAEIYRAREEYLSSSKYRSVELEEICFEDEEEE